MRSDLSFWERAFPPDDAPQGWRRWIALDPHHRTQATYWRKVRRRLAKAGITVEAATDEQVRAAISDADNFSQQATSARFEERALLAVKLRDQGMTYRRIGENLGGVSVERARAIHAQGQRILKWREYQERNPQ